MAAMALRLGPAWPAAQTPPLAYNTLGQPAVTLATVASYRQKASRCLTCQAIVMELTAQCERRNTDAPDDQDLIEMVYVQFLGIWKVQVVTPAQEGPIGPGWKSDIGVIRHVDKNLDSHPESELFADELLSTPIDESKVPEDRILGWKAYCDANHAGTCHGIQNEWMKWDSVDGLTLIDVIEECISTPTGSESYLALSYVWGIEGVPLVASRATKDALSERGSLASSSPLGRQLPRTIRDAMVVTSRLGYRYLWVDRLCIVQDDAEERDRLLAAMAAIYANASLTIIASHGNDSHGLPGVEPGWSPQRRAFDILALSGGTSLLFDDPRGFGEPLLPPSDRDYRRRGWTLQEELLSTRTLNFTKREVRWACQNMKCREIIIDAKQMKDNRQSSIELKLYQPFLDIATYGHLAKDFTGRLLTHDSDSVHAFSAIGATFSRTMGDMLHGLPELFFEGMLLWHPREPLVRRERHPGTAPSWSFLGWAGGGLDLGLWDELYANRGRRGSTKQSFASDHHLSSCVQFFKTDSRTGARMSVQSVYRANTLLKPGGDAPKAAAMTAFSRHCLYVPVPPKPLPPTLGHWLPVLGLETQRYHVRLGEVIPKAAWDSVDFCADVSLEDDKGRIVGGLRLNSTRREDDARPGHLAELVVISRCVTTQPRLCRMTPELRVFHADCPQPCLVAELCQADARVVPYEFYNVLWIGWEGETAFRKAAGRVLASYWDEQKPQNAHIMLG